MSNELVYVALYELAEELIAAHPLMKDEEGQIDGQNLFETIDDCAMVEYFQRLYDLFPHIGTLDFDE